MPKSKRKPLDPARFITPDERRERVMVMLQTKGFDNIHQLATAMGVGMTSLTRSLSRETADLDFVCLIAQTLRVNSSYLIER